MADAKIHENQAKHNYLVLQELQLKPDYRDWQIIVAFYTALHIIDCELEKKSPNWRAKYLSLGATMDVNWYAARGKAINGSFRDVYNNYRLLMEKSKTMRYLEAEAANKKAIDAISVADATSLINKNLGAIIKKFNYSW